MADKNGDPIMPDGPLPAPVRVEVPTGPRCLSCGATPHVGTRCLDPVTRHWRRRAVDAEARVAQAEAQVAAMRSDYERGKAAREAYEAWVALGRRPR